MSQPQYTGVEASRAFAPALWRAPVQSSAGLGWQDLVAQRYTRCPPAMMTIPGLHDHVMIAATHGSTRIDGRTARRIDGVIATPETLFLVPRAQPSTWTTDQPVGMLHLFIPPTLFTQLLPATDAAGAERLEIRELVAHRDPVLCQLLAALRGTLEESDPTQPLYANVIIQMLGAHLLRFFSNLTARVLRDIDPPRFGLSVIQLRRVTDQIDTELASNAQLTVAALASELGLSQYHFARLFKRTTGLAVHQYVMQQRITRACHLLGHSSLTISQIALAVGFSDHAHFNRYFVRAIGRAPREFRAQTQTDHKVRMIIQAADTRAS